MKDKAYEQKLWEQIEVHIPKISKREARFRQVDKIPTLGAFMKVYEKDCSDCLLYRKEIERVLVNLPEILKHKPVELEQEMEVWKKHLQENHGVYPEYYFNYRYGTYSFFVGLCLGALASYLLKGEVVFSIMGLITSVFLIAGVLYGSRLDTKIKTNGKNF